MNSKPNAISTLQQLSCSAVAKMFVKIIFSTLHENKEDFYTKIILKYKEFITINIPVPVHESIFFEATKIIEEYYKAVKFQVKKIPISVMISVFEILSQFKVQTLHFTYLPYRLRFFVIPHLHNMTALKEIELVGITVSKSSKLSDIIIRGISSMRNLVKFTLYNYCTDSIVKALECYCPKLLIFNAMFSVDLTNESIDYLANCKSLQSVNLNYTLVSNMGYIKLLTLRPDLISVGNTWYIINVLMQIFKMTERDFELQLVNLNLSNVKTEQLQVIIKLCPKLKSLELNCDMCEIAIISSLQNLQNLGLVKASFQDVIKVLETIGQNLHSLKLVCVTDVDMMAVGKNCPNLKYLLIDACTFANKIYCNVFHNLKYIGCGQNISNSQLKLLLSNCLNIKVIGLSDTNDKLNDDILLQVLQINPMTELEEICIAGNELLTIHLFEVLVNKCKKLKTLSKMNTCNAISSEELELFMQKYVHLNYESFITPFFIVDIYNLPN